MGFYEDERIRQKNQPYNSACEMYDAFKMRYWSNNDIMAFANECLEKDPTNRMMYALIELCNPRKEKDQTRTHNID